MNLPNNNLPINDNEFNDLFDYSNPSDNDKHEARLIMYRFLSEIERTSEQKRGLKKMLAKSVGKSSSYITQLFNGDKIVNLLTLAKFQRVLGIKFKIVACTESEFNEFKPNMIQNIFINIPVDKSITSGKSTTKEVISTPQTIKRSEAVLS
jgi:hypothetical protein